MLNGTVKWFNNKKRLWIYQNTGERKKISCSYYRHPKIGAGQNHRRTELSFDIVPHRSGRPEAHNLERFEKLITVD